MRTGGGRNELHRKFTKLIEISFIAFIYTKFFASLFIWEVSVFHAVWRQLSFSLFEFSFQH